MTNWVHQSAYRQRDDPASVLGRVVGVAMGDAAADPLPLASACGRSKGCPAAARKVGAAKTGGGSGRGEESGGAPDE